MNHARAISNPPSTAQLSRVTHNNDSLTICPQHTLHTYTRYINFNNSYFIAFYYYYIYFATYIIWEGNLNYTWWALSFTMHCPSIRRASYTYIFHVEWFILLDFFRSLSIDSFFSFYFILFCESNKYLGLEMWWWSFVSVKWALFPGRDALLFEIMAICASHSQNLGNKINAYERFRSALQLDAFILIRMYALQEKPNDYAEYNRWWIARSCWSGWHRILFDNESIIWKSLL